MPRSAKLEEEYRSFLRDFGLPTPTREVARQVITELQQGGREGLDFRSLDVSPDKLIGMIQAAGSGMQFVVDQLSMEIEKNIATAGLALNGEFFAGEFPTGSFNAQARAVVGGTLLLVNTGLMVFVHKASKLVSHAIRFAPFDNEGKPILKDEDDGGSALDHKQQVEAFAELVLAYLSAEDKWAQRTRRLPIASGAKAIFSAMVVHSCEKFVLAHEYGHAIAGHLNSAQKKVTRTPAGEVDLIAKSWSDEFEADLIATMLMLVDTPREVQTLEQLIPLQFVSVGPLFFFALDGLITNVAREITGLSSAPVVTDHPPSEMRMRSIRAIFERIGGVAVTQLADAYVEWVEDVGNDVVKAIREIRQSNAGAKPA